MSHYPHICLKPGKEEPLRRFHPWVFSGSIDHADKGISEGDIVEVISSSGDFLATGHALSGSIAVKVISFRQQQIDHHFWKEKLLQAYQYRQALGLTNRAETNAYRLVFGEGDGLPGLIVDIFARSAVIQCQTVGMYLASNEITLALKEIIGIPLESVFGKSAEALSKQSGFEAFDTYLLGNTLPEYILENGVKMALDFFGGQKTAYFLDQRENRALLAGFATGKKVLDLYCYSGGFSLNALKAGAAAVHAVDSSKKAIALFEKNMSLNACDSGQYKAYVQDVPGFLDSSEEQYDLVILDPPAFAKHHQMKAQAMKGYRNINRLAIQKTAPGGILFTFSCSQAVDRAAFQSAVTAAAIDCGRNTRIMKVLSQPPDHPVNIYHPEGEYLKGLVLYVG